MEKSKYTQEELELLDYMDTNPKSVNDVQRRISSLKQITQDNISKKKQVNFRMNEADLEKLKARSLVEGIPYQTLLNSIVHKFLNGTLA